MNFFWKDIYDLDTDGELSLPEIERMIQELYGVNGTNLITSMGKDALNDVNHYAEERGGFLNLVSFTCYTMVRLNRNTTFFNHI